jgi:hypothetical protein
MEPNCPKGLASALSKSGVSYQAMSFPLQRKGTRLHNFSLALGRKPGGAPIGLYDWVQNREGG